MPSGAPLEVISSYGDETLARLRFVLNVPSSSEQLTAWLSRGLPFAEGQAMISSDVVAAGALASQAGSSAPVVVWSVPSDFHLGYAAFTTAFIFRGNKRVIGSPLRFAAGRQQLALYTSDDVNGQRLRIEAEASKGFGFESQPQFTVEPKYILGTFQPNASFTSLIRQLDVSVRSLEWVDVNRVEQVLQELFQPTIPANAVLAPTAMHDIVQGTIEAIVMSELRRLRWRGLALLGFTFAEGPDELAIEPAASGAQQHQAIDELGHRLASSKLFEGDLAWMKAYISHHLGLMRIELDGAELEAIPD